MTILRMLPLSRIAGLMLSTACALTCAQHAVGQDSRRADAHTADSHSEDSRQQDFQYQPLPKFYRVQPTSGEVYDGLPAEERKPFGPESQFASPGRFSSPRPRENPALAAERLMHAGVLQQFLGLMQENFELKSQLRIQKIEFEAKQRIFMIEQEARQRSQEAEQRMAELESKIAELQRARQGGDAAGGMQEIRRQLIEQSRELERAQRSRAELEHRARALEAQLEEQRAKEKMLLKEAMERKEKEEREAEDERD